VLALSSSQPLFRQIAFYIQIKELSMKIGREYLQTSLLGTPNSDLEDESLFRFCRSKSRQKREKVHPCTPKCLPAIGGLGGRYGTQAWPSHEKASFRWQ
jgi:hypothetical protein